MDNINEARRKVYLGADEIELVFGTPTALDDADMITAVQIVDYIRKMGTVVIPTLARVALVAIAALSEDNPDLARSLILELNQAS